VSRASSCALGGAEGQHVDPGQRGRRSHLAAERGRGVGQAGAVEVQVQPVGMGHLGQGGDLVGPVERALLGRLRDGDDLRLGVVLVADHVQSFAPA